MLRAELNYSGRAGHLKNVEKIVLPRERVLGELYDAGDLREDILGNKLRYYPRALTKEEIIKKTGLPSEEVCKSLDFFVSEKSRIHSDEPSIIEVMVDNEKKYKITKTGITLLTVITHTYEVKYAEYIDKELKE